jgi:23S rRNA (cytosine1962-C5)-methyltransferase
MTAEPDYELIDLGGAARLERFGDRRIDRPAPMALGERAAPERWTTADLRYDRQVGWIGTDGMADPWFATISGLRVELRPTEAGQIGLFPEHIAQLPWLRARAAVQPPSAEVLHLFAYTGLVTLALATSGMAVAHVDASRPTVAWARRNAAHADLDDRPVRWIVDDARKFVAREARRGRRYAGVVLDPPTYGHGPGSAPWQIEPDLPGLLAACADVVEATGFVLLTTHTPGLRPERLADMIATAFACPPATIETGEMTIETQDGRLLDLGAFARSAGRA